MRSPAAFRASSRSGCSPAPTAQGVVLAAEVLVASHSVKETIRRPENNPPLKSLMEKGTHPYGMRTFQMTVERLLEKGSSTAPGRGRRARRAERLIAGRRAGAAGAGARYAGRAPHDGRQRARAPSAARTPATSTRVEARGSYAVMAAGAPRRRARPLPPRAPSFAICRAAGSTRPRRPPGRRGPAAPASTMLAAHLLARLLHGRGPRPHLPGEPLARSEARSARRRLDAVWASAVPSWRPRSAASARRSRPAGAPPRRCASRLLRPGSVPTRRRPADD